MIRLYGATFALIFGVMLVAGSPKPSEAFWALIGLVMLAFVPVLVRDAARHPGRSRFLQIDFYPPTPRSSRKKGNES